MSTVNQKKILKSPPKPEFGKHHVVHALAVSDKTLSKSVDINETQFKTLVLI